MTTCHRSKLAMRLRILFEGLDSHWNSFERGTILQSGYGLTDDGLPIEDYHPISCYQWQQTRRFGMFSWRKRTVDSKLRLTLAQKRVMFPKLFPTSTPKEIPTI